MNDGAWHAIDFHVHTPLSRCHEQEAWDERKFVATALAAGLDAVVVSDHHTSENAWNLLDVAEGTDLTVIPAMEVTTPEGHLLVMFDRDADRDVWQRLLQEIRLPSAQRGNGSYAVPVSMEEVISVASGLGSLCIPAHIDRWPNGFLERQIDFRARARIHGHADVVAVEITQPHMKPRWESGAVAPFESPITCVQGSDAHGLGEVGRRPTWVNSSGLALAELRAALRSGGATSFRAPGRCSSDQAEGQDR